MSESTRLERMVMACAAGAMAAESDEHGTWGDDHEAFAGHVLKRAKALDNVLARERAPEVFPTFPADATDEEIERASEPKKTDDAPIASHANEVENLRRMLDASNRALAECHKTLDTLDAILGSNGKVCTTDAARRFREAHERAFDGIVALLNEVSPQPFVTADVDEALAALGEWCRNAKSNHAQADPMASQEPTDEQIAREAAEHVNDAFGWPKGEQDEAYFLRAMHDRGLTGLAALVVRAYAAGRRATTTEQKREALSEDPIAHLCSCGGLRDRKLPTGRSMLLVLFESSEMVVCPGCRRVLKDRYGAWPRSGTDGDRPGFTMNLVVSFPPSYRMEVAVREAGVDELIHRAATGDAPV